MNIRLSIGGCALLLVSCTLALAQEDPEAVYAKLHRATLAGNAEEVMGYSTAATKAELAAKPPAERNALVRALAQAMPRTYTITEKSIAADGMRATLRGTGISEYQTRAEAYLTASFSKEGEAWKVASWGWSNQKPPPSPAKPVASAVAAASAVVAEPPPALQTVRRLPASAAAPASAAPTAPTVVPASPRKPSRSHLDARVCLRHPTDRAAMGCAEKYR